MFVKRLSVETIGPLDKYPTKQGSARKNNERLEGYLTRLDSEIVKLKQHLEEVENMLASLKNTVNDS